MAQKLALAEASPFFQLALDVGSMTPLPPDQASRTMRMVGESASEVGMALGAALILEGGTPAVAAGIALLTASLAARRKIKGRR